MIIPSKGYSKTYDKLFYSEKGFEAAMRDYIAEHFSQTLGQDARLLKLPNGLDLIADRLAQYRAQARRAA